MNEQCGCEPTHQNQESFNPSFYKLRVYITNYVPKAEEDDCGEASTGNLRISIKLCNTQEGNYNQISLVQLGQVIDQGNVGPVIAYLATTLDGDGNFEDKWRGSTALIDGSMYQNAAGKVLFRVKRLYDINLVESAP
ncbi:hypothetical protein [Algicola sagamiensis]|uniref:hypothetical protein n=1 Tax=Algicola sagamiensis TaxID=163869 RepID=UPI0003704DA1|nr:hypothetical protein [Algicola sagamiensis]